jgi:protoheme IX farnesyltransferase
LPRGRARDPFVTWQALVPAVLLLPLALLSALRGAAPIAYGGAAMTVSGLFLYYCLRFARSRSNPAARQLLAASIIYLPVIFLLMALN